MLIVEDDAAIAEQLVRGLRRAGCDATAVRTAAETAERRNADLILLDLGLPDGDGIDLCARLHRRDQVPIIVVTARGDEPERVAALDAGADDYVVKPFGFDELMARMRAVLRRTDRGPVVIQTGRLRIDVTARRVWVDESEVALTPKEFDILACLGSEPGCPSPAMDALPATSAGAGKGGPLGPPTERSDVGVALALAEHVATSSVGARQRRSLPLEGADCVPPSRRARREGQSWRADPGHFS